MPHAISVYNLSPITKVSSLVNPLFFIQRSPIILLGFPIKIGSLFTASFIILQIAPQSGTNPNLVGHTRSGFVAI